MQEGCEHKSNKIEPTIQIMNAGIIFYEQHRDTYST